MRTPEEILAACEDELFERAIYDVRAMNDRVLLRRMRADARDLVAEVEALRAREEKAERVRDSANDSLSRVARDAGNAVAAGLETMARRCTALEMRLAPTPVFQMDADLLARKERADRERIAALLERDEAGSALVTARQSGHEDAARVCEEYAAGCAKMPRFFTASDDENAGKLAAAEHLAAKIRALPPPANTT